MRNWSPSCSTGRSAGSFLDGPSVTLPSRVKRLSCQLQTSSPPFSDTGPPLCGQFSTTAREAAVGLLHHQQRVGVALAFTVTKRLSASFRRRDAHGAVGYGGGEALWRECTALQARECGWRNAAVGVQALADEAAGVPWSEDRLQQAAAGEKPTEANAAERQLPL